MDLLLGIDLGTSYFKTGVFAPDGTLRGLGRVAVAKRQPTPGHCELPVDEFWTLLRRGVAEALAQAGAAPSDVRALSYSSQANTFVLLDAADRPLTPLVLWTDTRAGAVPPDFEVFSRSDAFQQAVGFAGVVPESAVTKCRWFRHHEPDIWRRTARVLTISDYLTHSLTSERHGDASTAALLGLYHLQERRWWSEALGRFEVPESLLAQPLLPGTTCGRTTAGARALIGLPPGVRFAVGGLDHHVAAVGAGLGAFADASISTGTVLAAICLVDAVAPGAGCIHGPHIDGRRFYRLAFDPAGAAELEEFQRRFAPDQSIEQLIATAAAEAPGTRPAGAAWTTEWGGQPARAVRSILERIAVTHRGLVMRVADGPVPARISATGGGARSAEWLAIKADVIGTEIVTPACAERACLGAAVFAAAAAGIHPDIAEAARVMVRPARTFQPDPDRHRFYAATGPRA